MIAYLDTSALTSRYVPEPGSAVMNRLFRRRPEIAVAAFTLVELFASVARAARDRRITLDDRDRIISRAPDDFLSFSIVELRRRVVLRVFSLVTKHPLRGFDALQLASCLETRRSGPTELWAADGALITAARAEGLKVVVL